MGSSCAGKGARRGRGAKGEEGSVGRKDRGRADGAVRVGIAVRPRVYVPARELISREPLCSLTDQTTTGHYAPSTHVGNTCVRLGRSRGRIKANLHDTLFDDHRVDASLGGKTRTIHFDARILAEKKMEELKPFVFLLSSLVARDLIAKFLRFRKIEALLVLLNPNTCNETLVMQLY